MTVYPRVGGRAKQVMDLLADGKWHKTNELPLPPRTRDWPTSQAEDRWKWFQRLYNIGLINKTYPVKWKISKLGVKWAKGQVSGVVPEA
jgi:hypothetical protein